MEGPSNVRLDGCISQHDESDENLRYLLDRRHPVKLVSTITHQAASNREF